MDTIKDRERARSGAGAAAHEGEAIRRALRDAGRTIADLARAASVSHPAAAKYLAAPRLGAKARESAARGLSAMGLDPTVVFGRIIVEDRAARTAPELRALLDGFAREQLVAVAALLDADDDERRIMRVVIADRVERR